MLFRSVSFKNTIIIMTSNVGSQFIRMTTEAGDKKTMDASIQEALRATFRPEFLNRIDDIVTFNSLDTENLESIVELQLRDVRERLDGLKIKFTLGPAAKERLAMDGFDPVYGARPLKRLIQREIVDRIANAMIAGEVHEGSEVMIDLDDANEYAMTVL